MDFMIQSGNSPEAIKSNHIDLNLIDDEFRRIMENKEIGANFFILEPSSKIQCSTFLQVIYAKNRGFLIEIQLERDGKLEQYRSIFKEKEIVIKLFRDYYFNNIIPDYKSWMDITDYVIGNNSDDNGKEIRNQIIVERKNEIDDDEGIPIPEEELILEQDQINLILKLLDDPELGSDFKCFLQDLFKENIAENAMWWTGIDKYLQKKGITCGFKNLSIMYSRESGKQEGYFLHEKLNMIFRPILDEFYIYKENEFYDLIFGWVDDCIRWKPNNKKFTKAEIDLYFLEKLRNKNIKVTGPKKDMFRVKVNEKLNMKT